MPLVPPETLKELVALRQRVEYLEAEIALLRDIEGEQVKAVAFAFDCTAQQACILIAMARVGILTRQQALDMDLHHREDAGILSLDSSVKRIRKRIPSIKIKSHYGIGYELEPESRKAVRDILNCTPKASVKPLTGEANAA